jgi:hypothetical protein
VWLKRYSRCLASISKHKALSSNPRKEGRKEGRRRKEGRNRKFFLIILKARSLTSKSPQSFS